MNGKDKAILTTATEAFSLLQYENSRARWIAIFEWKAKPENKGKKVPNYNSKKPETAKFKGKWSDYAHGQGSGWDPKALKVFNKRRKDIIEFRREDKEHDYARLKEARDMIRAHYEIPDDQDEYPAKKKRKIEVTVSQVQDDDAEAGESDIGEDFVDDDE